MDFAFIWIFLLAQLIVSFIYCFFGYKFFRTVIALYIFMLVFPGIMSFFGEVSTLEPTVTILISLGIAALAAFLAFALFKVAIFCCGGILGLLIAVVIISVYPMGDSMQLFLKIGLFVAMGLVAYFLKKGIVVIVTALSGAYTFMLYLHYMINNMGAIVNYDIFSVGTLSKAVMAGGANSGFWFIAPIIMGILGIVIQAAVTGKKPQRELK